MLRVRPQFEIQGVCQVDLDLEAGILDKAMSSFFVCSSLWGLKLLFCIPDTSSSMAVTSFAGPYIVCI